jgi:pyruvate kinase
MSHKLDYIHEQLQLLEKDMEAAVLSKAQEWGQLSKERQESAINLIRYMSLRIHDIRQLQDLLHVHGLSSLASSESHILRQIQAIRERLGHTYQEEELDTCTFPYSKLIINNRSRELFGERSKESSPHLMVTFDKEFIGDIEKIKKLMESGMDIARINCAHDDPQVWKKMVEIIQEASKETGRSCKIYMDLAGPKIRTTLLGKGKGKGKVKLKKGDLIWMIEPDTEVDEKEILISPGEKGVVESLKLGERVYLDDGMIHCIVEKIKKHKVGLKVIRVSTKKDFLKEEKGINFPDSSLNVSSLTEADFSNLPFICMHADLIGYSFVRNKADILAFRTALQQVSESYPHIILKIETKEAVDNLASLVLEILKEPAAGIMIARGDLAVEIGFERLSEIQEEILWICESAHMPVIWATQVLENLHKSGLATRSEITDAVHAAMAECIMINKGDYTIEVMKTLKDIWKRTATHRVKKRFVFRPLKIAERFFKS